MANAKQTICYISCDKCGDPKSGGCSCETQNQISTRPPMATHHPIKTFGNSPAKPRFCSNCLNEDISPCSCNTQPACGFWFCCKECNDNHFHTKKVSSS